MCAFFDSFSVTLIFPTSSLRTVQQTDLATTAWQHEPSTIASPSNALVHTNIVSIAGILSSCCHVARTTRRIDVLADISIQLSTPTTSVPRACNSPIFFPTTQHAQSTFTSFGNRDDMRPDGPRDLFAGPDSGPAPPFPLKLDGKVIKGFGRGSSEVSELFTIFPSGPDKIANRFWNIG